MMVIFSSPNIIFLLISSISRKEDIEYTVKYGNSGFTPKKSKLLGIEREVFLHMKNRKIL